MDKQFIHLATDNGELLLNLYQIVRISSITDESITIDMSDGEPITLHGKEEIDWIMELFHAVTMTIDGRDFFTAVEEIAKQQTLGPQRVQSIYTTPPDQLKKPDENK